MVVDLVKVQISVLTSRHQTEFFNALLQMQRYYERFGATLNKVMLFTGASDRFLATKNLYEKKGFRIVATIPKNALDNPYAVELLYVLQLASQNKAF